MRRRWIAGLAAAVVVSAAAPASARLLAVDGVALDWGIGGTLTAADGTVTVDATVSTEVQCSGATAIVTVTLAGEAPGTVVFDQRLMTGTVEITGDGITQTVEGGCSEAAAVAAVGSLTVTFDGRGSVVRDRVDGVRVIERSGAVLVSGLGLNGVAAAGVATRTITK
jgi:hypothetical protein